MTLTPEELLSRRPVWEALSDLFLDTDVSLARQWRIEALAQSVYSVAELEAILVDEVYPVCKYNLFSIAGEWAGFDSAWLESRIVRRLASPLRVLRVVDFGRLTFHRSSEWRATREGIVAVRQSTSSGTA